VIRLSDDFIKRAPVFMRDGSGSITPREPESIIQGDIENKLNAINLGVQVLMLMADPILLNVLCEDPSGGTLTDISGNGHDGTYTGTWSDAQKAKMGRCFSIDFNGTDNYINFGDSDDFSFGDGSNDEAFTLFGVFEILDVATYRTLFAKYDISGAQLREYVIYMTSAKKLEFLIGDESAGVTPKIVSDSVIAAGTHSIVATYDGGGGATAANGLEIYIDGALEATTPTNSGTYVAMENLATHLFIGALKSTNPASFMNGKVGCLGIDASEWSAATVHKFHQLCLAAYSEDGVAL
jgi:hypothetical protein